MTQPTAARPAAACRRASCTSSLRVFDLSLGEMLWSRRTIFMALVVGAPVFIALLLRVLDRPRRAGLHDMNTGRTTIG